jgi:hypothetical protein
MNAGHAPVRHLPQLKYTARKWHRNICLDQTWNWRNGLSLPDLARKLSGLFGNRIQFCNCNGLWAIGVCRN